MPKLRTPTKRNTPIMVRYTDDETIIVQARADARGEALSAYVRRRSLEPDTMREDLAEMRDILERLRDHAIIARLPQSDSVPGDWEGQSDYQYKPKEAK